MESVRREHCLKCGSVELTNYFHFRRGEDIHVYIRCARCGEFVSRYRLMGYTSNEVYEGLIQKLNIARRRPSDRNVGEVEAFSKKVAETYDHVLKLGEEEEDQRRIETIISRDYPETMHPDLRFDSTRMD
ncbi:MAG: hypothetical protein K9N36_04715 [Candidatus Marinimicrobia bacterium]|nr:hypothetical protein [Candidatus Neomarinimicrobiota bacterium]